jgi:hypothetical protein
MSLIAAIILVSCSTLQPFAALPDTRWPELATGIGYAAFSHGSPRSEVHALRVDLGEVNVVVTPGSGRVGIVVGNSVSGFAGEFGCVAAVNATPFSPATDKVGEDRILTGILVHEGRLESAPAPRYAALVFGDDGSGWIVRQSDPLDLSRTRFALGGFFVLLEGGTIVARESRREPMTVAGLSPDGRILYVAVIDGRRPGSAGMTEREAAALLAMLGATQGLGFDGGASSAMAIRFGDGPPRIVNLPIHGGIPGRERVVGTCLGFRSRGANP